MHPDYKIETTIANGEFMIATGIVAASKWTYVRRHGIRANCGLGLTAWWMAPRGRFISGVFSVFGVVTLAVVGIYLIWRSRQAHMSSALTTAGWAILVLIAVNGACCWPVKSANLADKALIGTLGVVHDAIGPSVCAL
jgi:hypothetical protein